MAPKPARFGAGICHDEGESAPILVEAVMRRSAVQKMTVAAIDIKPDASSPPRPESTRGQATLCAVRVMR